jgi:hypothetical protein
LSLTGAGFRVAALFLMIPPLKKRRGNPPKGAPTTARINEGTTDAEKAFEVSRLNKATYKGPEVMLCGKDEEPIVPLKLDLTAEEKRDLVLFLRALQGDPADPIVADRSRLPE